MTTFHYQKSSLMGLEKLELIFLILKYNFKLNGSVWTLTNPNGNLTSKKMYDEMYAKRVMKWNSLCILFRHGNYHVIKYCYGHVVKILWRQNRPSIDLWLLFRDNGDSVNKNKSVNNTNIKNGLEKTISSKTVSSFSSSFWVPIHNTLFYRLSRLGCWRRVRGISHVDFYG